MAEKEYIDREILLKMNFYTENCNSEENRWNDYAIKDIIKHIPAADVAPVKHGHIVWKEYHKGGIRRRKCLQEIKSVYIEQQMPCKHIAIVDERYLSKDPYCSECGMLLGEFLSYCGNCGAKMDGGKSDE